MKQETATIRSIEKGAASELLTMSSANRVGLLRKLTKAEALTSIDDIKQALALNRDEDIAADVCHDQRKRFAA